MPSLTTATRDERQPGIGGITLRAVREADLGVLERLRNDPILQELLLAHPQPNSRDEVRAWITRRSRAPSEHFWVVARGTECIGFAQITGLDLRDGHAHLGICLAAEVRGMGLGRAALGLLEAAAGDVGTRKLVLQVRSDNGPAVELYRSGGYRSVGTLARHFMSSDGARDVLVMEKFLDRRR